MEEEKQADNPSRIGGQSGSKSVDCIMFERNHSAALPVDELLRVTEQVIRESRDLIARSEALLQKSKEITERIPPTAFSHTSPSPIK